VKLILDIESSNHLHKECDGDVSLLRIGVAGVKVVDEETYRFFTEDTIHEIEALLLEADEIIGFNLVSSGGLDYQMLRNHDVAVEFFSENTFDIMEIFIESFGNFSYFSLENIAEHTLGLPKKKRKNSNYKLIRNGHIDKVKDNLKHELGVIEKLYLHLLKGGQARFKTPGGLVNEHDVNFLLGYNPESKKELCDNYDFIGSIRLQLKDTFDEIVMCEKCESRWRIKSSSYFGDTMKDDVHCGSCGTFLVTVPSNFSGPPLIMDKVE